MPRITIITIIQIHKETVRNQLNAEEVFATAITYWLLMNYVGNLWKTMRKYLKIWWVANAQSLINIHV